MLLAPAASRAVITFDLLHDTPATRESLKDELSSPALSSPEAPAVGAVAAEQGGLQGVWFTRERYLQLGESERAHQQLQLLWEQAVQQGIQNLPEYGAVLVREARRRRQSGDYDQAARILSYTRKIAPDYLPVYAEGAVLALRRNLFNVVPVWEELTQAARAARRSFRIQAWLAGSLYLGAAAGIALLFAVSTAALFVREGPRVAHDLREALPFGGSPRARTVLSWVLLATPALAGLSPVWWLVIAGALLIPYVGPRQRALLALGAVFAFALPWVVHRAADFLALSRRPVLEKVVQIREGHWSAADYQGLRGLLRDGGGAVELAVLGSAALHLGRPEEAEAALHQGLKAAPDDPVLLNGLGNLEYARQNLPLAVELYGKAALAAPALFAPHYNLAQAYREQFKFAEGEAESNRAAQLDAEGSSSFSGLDASRVGRFAVDALPPAAAIWALARSRDENGEEPAQRLWESFMLGPTPGAWPFAVAVLLLLGGAHWYLRRDDEVAQACPRCGRVFCARCQSGRPGQLCSQCHHIFVRKEGVDARARVEKMAEIKSHRHRQRWLQLGLSALAPGAGHLAAGQLRPGLLFLVPAAFYEARALGFGAYTASWSLGSPLSGLLSGAAALLFAAWWAASLWLVWHVGE